ncbi:response regulator [Amycolatopsis sp. NPDC059657]|uniref:response regulator n=1 Tax=Amycolatopsis sp. NPDC059657 TaxID=3346899 RepID=UPI00366B2233
MGATVVLADDDEGTRDDLRDLLAGAEDITVVAEAGTTADTERLLTRHRPDVLLVDPRMCGPAGLFALAKTAGATAILVFTTLDDDGSLVTAMRAGARGYLRKNASGEQLRRMIRGLAAGQALFDAHVACRVTTLLCGDRRPTAHQLTTRQREVFDLVVLGIPDSAIARRLRLSPKTVRNHVSAILTQLNATSRAYAIERYVKDSVTT